MIRSFELLARAFVGLAAFAGAAAAQALPEYSAGTAGTLGTAGASSAIGKSIGGVIGNLQKSLPPADSAKQDQSAQKNAPTPATQPGAGPYAKPTSAADSPSSADPASAAPPPPKYEDPSQIQVSLAYDEVLRRFGPPAMEITTEESVKKLLYMSPSGPVHIEVVDGVVTSAPKPKS